MGSPGLTRPVAWRGHWLGPVTAAGLLHAGGLALATYLLAESGPTLVAELDVETIDPLALGDLIIPRTLPPLEDGGQVVTAVGLSDDQPNHTPYIAEHAADPRDESWKEQLTDVVRPGLPARRPGEVAAPAPAPAQGAVLPAAAPEDEALPTRSAATEDEVARDGSTRYAREVTPAPLTNTDVGTAAPEVTLGLGDGSNDVLPELPRGELTAVKARSAAQAAYINDVVARMRPYWKAREVFNKAAPSRTIASKELESVVRLRFRPDGSLEAAELKERCGLAPLDEEAVAVFARAEPFARPPMAILDARGGFEFDVRLTLELTVSQFLEAMKRTLRESWRPSPAFRMSGDHERVTVARVLVTPDGVLTHAQVVSSAGIEFLDKGVLESLKSGLRLPGPPVAYGDESGLVPLWIEYHHRVREPSDLRVLKPRERPPVQ